MSLKNYLLILLLSFSLLTACALSPTPSPIETTDIPAPVVSAPQVTALQKSTILAGPNTDYAAIGMLAINQTAEVIGRDESGAYWVIRFDAADNGRGWVPNNSVAIQGDTTNTPIVIAPQIPSQEVAEVAPEPVVVEEPTAAPANEDAPAAPTAVPTEAPIAEETAAPTAEPTAIPEEPTAVPTVAPPVIDDEIAPPASPTPAPTIGGIVALPTPTPAITIVDGFAVAPTATPITVIIMPFFFEQATYTQNCAQRPENTVCLAFSDGYIWLIEDAVLSRTTGESYQGKTVEIVEGIHGYYHHPLNTSLIKFVPKS